MPLDTHAVRKVIAHGASIAAVHAASHHSAGDVWKHTAAGSGHQGSTDLLHLPDSDFNSTPLSNVPGALQMQAGDLGGAVVEIGKAQGALATTGALFGALTAAEQMVSTLVSAIPFPAFPAVRVSDFDVGLPHAHNHPPNLIPPAPPIPLPSTGPVIAIPYVSGAATVLINGMPAGRCGDVGMGIWCGGFFPMFEIFLGSSSVWLEGMRAARIGVDITKHCTFSAPKPEDPPMGPMIGTTISASPNVIIGGVPMPSLTAMAVGAVLKVAFKGLGKVIRLAQATKTGAAFARSVGKAANDLMDHLGVGPASALRNRVNRALCAVTGHPVDIATGKVFVDAIDFELPGPLPLIWQRVWYSTSTYDGPLGQGWHHSLDQAISLGADTMAIRLGDGRAVILPLSPIGQTHHVPTEQLWVTRHEDSVVVQTFGRLNYHFGPAAGCSTWPLQRITFLQNWVRLDRDGTGLLTGLETSSGRRLVFRHDDRRLLLSVDLLLDGSAECSRLIEHRYDEHGRLREVLDCLRECRTLYDYRGNLLVEEVAANGGRFRFTYDGVGPFARCVRTEGDGRALYRDLTYDDAAQCTQVGYLDDAPTRHDWLPDGTVWRTEIEPGFEILTRRDEQRDPSVVSTAYGGSFQFSRDAATRSVTVVHPRGFAFRFERDENDQPYLLETPDGSIWLRHFDERGELESVIDPAGNAFRYDHDGRGLLRSIASPDGMHVAFAHDAAGMLASETDWAGFITRFEHDRLGRLARVELPDGAIYAMERDAAGRLVTLHRPDGSMRSYAWDAMNDLVSYRDEGGAVWQWSYNKTRQPVKIARPDGSLVTVAYDSEDRPTEIINRRGGRTTFERDRRGRVVRETDFGGRITNYVYGKGSRVVAVERCDGTRVIPDYDLDGQLVGLTDAQSRKTSWTYDWRGRLTAAADDGSALELTYDPCGNLVRSGAAFETKPPASGAIELRYQYDARGRRIARSLSCGANLGFSYDANGWLCEVRRDGNLLLQIERDARGRPVAICCPGGARLDQDFDTLGRLIGQNLEGADPYRRTYRYNEFGTLSEVVEDDRTVLHAEYDSFGRLVRVASEGNWPYGEITRDQRGFATSTSNGASLELAPDGRVTACDDAQPVYNDLGHLVQVNVAGGRLRLDYDGRDRLSRVSRDGEDVASYGYDALDRRIWKCTSGETRHFIWDDWTLVAEIVGDRVTEYIVDPATQMPLARLAGGTLEIYHTDQVGVPFRVSDGTGRCRWTAAPDLEHGCVPRAGGTVAQPLRLPGQYHDEETGLHYNGYRYYSPGFGRYISPDPAGVLVSEDLYGYVDNPLDQIDPWGLVFERPYSNSEVTDILDASEGRPSPTTGVDGHSRKTHVNQTNEQLRDRVHDPSEPNVTSTFEGSQAQNRAATEALNSPAGQAKLRELDLNPTKKRVTINAPTSGETVRGTRLDQGWVKRGRSTRTTVTVDVLDRTPGAEVIHIQTCYGRL
jgi:RHS repeat-associated protein